MKWFNATTEGNSFDVLRLDNVTDQDMSPKFSATVGPKGG